MHHTLYVSGASAKKETGAPNSRNYKSIKNYKEQIHLMHYTSPAHPQEKKQEYQIDDPQRLVAHKLKLSLIAHRGLDRVTSQNADGDGPACPNKIYR